MARGNGCNVTLQAATRGGAPAGAEASHAELTALFPDDIMDAWMFMNGDMELRDAAAPPRTALEAVLAAEAGISESDFAILNAHRSWSELWQEANTSEPTCLSGGRDDRDERSLHQIATHLIDDLRRYEDGRSWTWLSPHRFDATTSALLTEAATKQGPGKNSGRLEDYSRSELCRMLGYLLHEASELSDDTLRSMALDAGLVPAFRGAPSHVELGWRFADRVSETPQVKARYFREALRTPYRKAAAKYAGQADESGRDAYQLIEEIRAEHPWLAHALTCSGKAAWVRLFAEKLGIPTHYRESDRYQAETETRFVSSLERRHGAALYAHLDSIGGGKLTRIVGHGRDGQWSALKPGKHALAYYTPATGELHLSAKLDAIIRKAEQGKASATARYLAAEALAHELEHASSGGNGGSGYESKRCGEHTIEEGEVEILARLQADELGHRLGLCGPDESLRAASRGMGVAYPHETETMIALYAAATGELDTHSIADGGYREPERLSAEARQLVRTIHRGTGLYWRSYELAQRIAPRCGRPADEVQDELHELMLLSKDARFSEKVTPSVSERGKLFSEQLAERLTKLLAAS
jgi:hypothetical protein